MVERGGLTSVGFLGCHVVSVLSYLHLGGGGEGGGEGGGGG